MNLSTIPRLTSLLFLWLDLACLAMPARAEDTLVIKNGGMTQGTNIPAGWTGKSGNAKASRDTTDFKVGPASLRLDVSDDKKGMAYQRLKAGGSREIEITGWVRSRGNVKAQVAVHAFAKGYKKNKYLQVVYFQKNTDWKEFTKKVSLPEWTSFYNILLSAEGDGSAWLDEVRPADGKVDEGRPVSLREEMVESPPSKEKPWVPGWCIYNWRSQWFAMHDKFVKRTKQGGIDIVFYGDSITMGWSNAGKQVWAKHFAERKAVNYGIGGDSTRQLLWRIGHGEVEGITPKLVVLAVGTNNLYSDQNAGSDEEIAQGITATVKLLREKLPRTKILVLGLLPRQNAYFCRRVRNINKRIQKLDEWENVRYLDVGDKFIKTPDTVNPDLFKKDKLHLDAAGYQVWADAILPTINELMGETD